MTDPTSRVLTQLDFLDSSGESYSLGPFRNGLPPVTGVVCIGRLASSSCSLDNLHSVTSWAQVDMIYTAILSQSLFLPKNTEEQKPYAVLLEHLHYIQHYVSRMRPGEYGYTPEETELMERWNVQPQRVADPSPLQSDEEQKEEEEEMETVD